MKTLIWLDDSRDPLTDDWLVFSPIEQPYEVIWVKSYQEFIERISINGLPTAICFDHDLDWDSQNIEEKTGMDCALWLVDYCMDLGLVLPLYNIQSANPVGKENIDKLLKNFIKFYK